ncbi:MAG TPA: penicillin-binding protein 2 [Alphaproteobacteria bacterium]|nr:penicillin-binding protein 2 [Micavibrio sp.]MBK9561763.1 penicillin-binding protein 2 [Micavibrio sp.]HQX26632.1 penicillin-binding protein 2 [Alphaproteobacteria bacterium]
MKRSSDNEKFTRRAFFVGAAQGTFLVVLGGRLAWLQIAQGSRYKTLSDENRINTKILPPTRGQIVDRFGVPLAVNNQNFRVLIIPEQAENLEKSLRALQKYIDVEESSIQTVLKQAKKSPKYVPLEIKDDLSWEEVAKVEVNLPDLPGLSTNVGEIRGYPLGEATAHLIGYVGAVNKNELTSDPLLSVPGFKIGKSAIEKTHDLAMRGKAGSSDVEVNVVGREVRELKRIDPVPGERVMLTIDGELQRFAQKRLSEQQSASAVVMNVHSGEVYALASYPAFDPNVFSRGISAALWEELLANPGFPLTNKAIAGQYPPGSTFKMITALAGLKAGKITTNRTVFCPGHYILGKGRFHCWKKGGHGYVNLSDALAKSCDVFFYQMANEMGIDAISEMASQFGLGKNFGFDLSEERPGLVPTRDWKKARFNETWQPGETIVNAIGQGYFLTTPLQLAVMTARLVNGGYEVKPQITGYVGDKSPAPQKWPKMKVPDAHLKLMMQGMNKVVNHERGTAYGSRVKDPPEFAYAGKTGTAQVRRITMQQRASGVKNEDLAWRERHHALFVGYAPLDKPVYACAVVVEHGVGGALTAAPIARDLLVEVQKRNPAGTPVAVQSAPAPAAQIKAKEPI